MGRRDRADADRSGAGVLTGFLSASKIEPISTGDRPGMREPLTAELPPIVGKISRAVVAPATAVAAPVVDVVVPVFDEERSIGPSIRRIHAYLSGYFPFSWRITIV